MGKNKRRTKQKLPELFQKQQLKEEKNIVKKQNVTL